jgi:hypothetical protein
MPLCSLKRVGSSAALLLALLVVGWAPSVALAEDVVHLKAGGSVRGQIMELIPNQYVNLLLADGTSRRVPWEEVQHVYDDGQAATPNAPTPQPPPMIQEFTPQASAPPVAPAAVVPPQGPGRAEVLRAEIATIQQQQRQLDGGGTAIMLGTGYVGLSLVLPGLMILGAASAVCEEGCSGLYVVGASILSVSVVAMVIGVIGLGQHSDISAQRSENARQLFVREQELRSLSYDLTLGPQRADAVLRIHF